MKLPAHSAYVVYIIENYVMGEFKRCAYSNTNEVDFINRKVKVFKCLLDRDFYGQKRFVLTLFFREQQNGFGRRASF